MLYIFSITRDQFNLILLAENRNTLSRRIVEQYDLNIIETL